MVATENAEPYTSTRLELAVGARQVSAAGRWVTHHALGGCCDATGRVLLSMQAGYWRPHVTT